MVEQQNPENFKRLMDTAQEHIGSRYALYEQLAKVTSGSNGGTGNKA